MRLSCFQRVRSTAEPAKQPVAASVLTAPSEPPLIISERHTMINNPFCLLAFYSVTSLATPSGPGHEAEGMNRRVFEVTGIFESYRSFQTGLSVPKR